MKAARLIVLGVALAAGGVAAMLASGGRQPEPPKAPAPAPPPLATVDVLVAKSDLGVGQVVGTADVGWQTWPAASANSNFVRKTDRPDAIKDFVGAVVRTAVAAGEPIRDSKVVMAKGGGFMAAILPHGMRAISLDVAPDTGAGGFILPDDHVDVVLTRRDKAAEKLSGVEKYISETILRNVRVLAVDQTVDEKDGQKVLIGKTATIELDPRQAETLALSHQLGTISLTLRSLLDSQSPTPEGGEAKEEPRTTVNTVRYGVTTQTTPR
jgi:pilus assembly protein CpaB